MCYEIRRAGLLAKACSKTCRVFEADFSRNDFGFSYAEINGRYPEVGFAINTACDLIYFIHSGSCKINFQESIFELKCGEAFFIEKNNKYFVIGENAVVALFESPKWRPEQYKWVK